MDLTKITLIIGNIIGFGVFILANVLGWEIEMSAAKDATNIINGLIGGALALYNMIVAIIANQTKKAVLKDNTYLLEENAALKKAAKPVAKKR